jgi:hypothetical protein
MSSREKEGPLRERDIRERERERGGGARENGEDCGGRKTKKRGWREMREQERYEESKNPEGRHST